MNRFLLRVDPLSFAVHSCDDAVLTAGAAIFFAGFIGNHTELREAARQDGSGPDPDGYTDARLFAWAYGRWGTDVSRHVLGEFAAAVVDHRARTVLLTQDSLGLHPQFYATHNGDIFAASHLLDLISALDIRAVDEEYIADFIATSLPSSSRTPFCGVHRLSFGSTEIWHAGRWTRQWPWRPDDLPPARLSTAQQYEEALLDLLGRAANSVVPPSGKIWCELSGGLDSSTVLALVAPRCKRIEAFSFFHNSLLDKEHECIRSVLAKYPVKLHTAHIEDHPPFSALPSSFCAEPGTEIVAPQQQAYDQLLAAHDVGTVLTGMGGDAAFGSQDWAPHHLADFAVTGRLRGVWVAVRQWRKVHPSNRSSLFWLWKYACRSAIRHQRGRLLNAPALHRFPSWLDGDYVRTMRLHDRFDRRPTPRCQVPGREALWQDAFLDASVLKAGHALHKHAEFRHPLFFRPLLEFLFSIPYEERRLADRDRDLQRRALADILPEQVRLRTTKELGAKAL